LFDDLAAEAPVMDAAGAAKLFDCQRKIAGVQKQKGIFGSVLRVPEIIIICLPFHSNFFIGNTQLIRGVSSAALILD
jgi:hypothetical protein